MANPIETISTPTGEYQAHFGSFPGSSDAVTECKKWQDLCADLLAERDTLRAALAQVTKEYDACKKTLLRLHCSDYQPTFTKADVDAAIAKLNAAPTVQDIINKIENAQGT